MKWKCDREAIRTQYLAKYGFKNDVDFAVLILEIELTLENKSILSTGRFLLPSALANCAFL
jgi:hypothetical protein